MSYNYNIKEFIERMIVMKIYDSDIRSLLLDSFLEIDEYTNEEDTVVINELDVCSGISRVDIAVINGKLHGYEIKSMQDNLDRLPYQMESYNQIFDTMTIVAYEDHIKKIKAIVPKWWEIKSVSHKKEQFILKTIRLGKQNSNINVYNVAMLLWKDEMIDLLLSHSNIIKGYKSKTRSELAHMIEQYIDTQIVLDWVRNTLKNRQGWKAVSLQMLNDD